MNDIFLGQGSRPIFLYGKYANRHGMVAGATGTGKSVSLMTLIEGFSKLGVPTFIADVKGDLAGLSQAGVMNDKLSKQIARTHQDWVPRANPVEFWDIYGNLGRTVRTTVESMGPVLLGRMLELSDTQQGVLEILFHRNKDQGYNAIESLDDLREMLRVSSAEVKEISSDYGLVSAQSIAAIQRSLLSLSSAGGNELFGKPTLNFMDFIRQGTNGQGIVNILAAEHLILNPKLYTSFLLWLLTELFENLPEVGDRELPKFVMFFDEAHLLFQDAPVTLRRRIEQVVRLIRSKGVGIYFCSQKPDDIPEDILGQLGNRIQHALRAFTVRDQKSVRAAAETFTMNAAIDVEDLITKLGVGEALVSTLSDNGTPTPVERVVMSAPGCRIGSVTMEERQEIMEKSALTLPEEEGPITKAFQSVSRLFRKNEPAKARIIEMERGPSLMDFMRRSH